MVTENPFILYVYIFRKILITEVGSHSCCIDYFPSVYWCSPLFWFVFPLLSYLTTTILRFEVFVTYFFLISLHLFHTPLPIIHCLLECLTRKIPQCYNRILSWHSPRQMKDTSVINVIKTSKTDKSRWIYYQWRPDVL